MGLINIRTFLEYGHLLTWIFIYEKLVLSSMFRDCKWQFMWNAYSCIFYMMVYKKGRMIRCQMFFLFSFSSMQKLSSDYVNAESWWFLLCASLDICFSPLLFLCLQAQTDLASLAFIPLAFLDTALCWWISFSLACLMTVHFLPLEMGFHWSFCKEFLSVLLITP